MAKDDITDNALEASRRIQDSLKNVGDAARHGDLGGVLYHTSEIVKYTAQSLGHASADEPVQPGNR